MIGSLINAAAILLAGLAGCLRLPAMSLRAQRWLQAFLGLVTMGLGFHVIWRSLHGSLGHMIRELTVVMLAVVLGKVTGQWLGVQSLFNRFGQFARERLAGGEDRQPRTTGGVFTAATIVFCLTPLAIVGPLQEGLRDDWRALLIKSAVDGLATLALARTHGWPVVLAAVPVLSLQGSLGLLVLGLRPGAWVPGTADTVYATSGFILVATALVMLQVLRVRLADYLPGLLWGAVLGWLLL